MAQDSNSSPDDEPAKEASGATIGRGKAPFALVILYLIILVWALLAWLRPTGS